MLKISKVIYLLWKLLPLCKNDREEDNKFLSQSLLHPLIFQKRIYLVFWSSFGSCPLQFPDQLPYDYLNLGLKRLPILQMIFTCFWKTSIKTMNLLSSVIIEQLSLALLFFFKKILENLSHPRLVLLFQLSVGRCCLPLLAFVKRNAVMSTYTCKTLHWFRFK